MKPENWDNADTGVTRPMRSRTLVHFLEWFAGIKFREHHRPRPTRDLMDVP